MPFPSCKPFRRHPFTIALDPALGQRADPLCQTLSHDLFMAVLRSPVQQCLPRCGARARDLATTDSFQQIQCSLLVVLAHTPSRRFSLHYVVASLAQEPVQHREPNADIRYSLLGFDSSFTFDGMTACRCRVADMPCAFSVIFSLMRSACLNLLTRSFSSIFCSTKARTSASGADISISGH